MKNLKQKQLEHLCFVAGVEPESLPKDARPEDVMTRFLERFEAEKKLLKKQTSETPEQLEEMLTNWVRYPGQEKKTPSHHLVA